MEYGDAISLFNACYERCETSGHDMWQAITGHIKAAEDHAATMETCARDAEEKLKGSVPPEKVQAVIDEIWAEIKHMEGHSNIGKLGCARRLEALIPKDGK